MFTDPQSLTINSVATSLPRVAIGESSATYRSADETVQLRISHRAYKGRKGRMVRMDVTKVAPDPLTAENAEVRAAVYLVVDEPTWGFSDTELQYYVTALKDWVLVSGNVGKLLGGES